MVSGVWYLGIVWHGKVPKPSGESVPKDSHNSGVRLLCDWLRPGYGLLMGTPPIHVTTTTITTTLVSGRLLAAMPCRDLATETPGMLISLERGSTKLPTSSDQTTVAFPYAWVKKSGTVHLPCSSTQPWNEMVWSPDFDHVPKLSAHTFPPC